VTPTPGTKRPRATTRLRPGKAATTAASTRPERCPHFGRSNASLAASRRGRCPGSFFSPPGGATMLRVNNLRAATANGAGRAPASSNGCDAEVNAPSARSATRSRRLKHGRPSTRQ
jgi:hypothetical protein